LQLFLHVIPEGKMLDNYQPRRGEMYDNDPKRNAILTSIFLSVGIRRTKKSKFDGVDIKTVQSYPEQSLGVKDSSA